jgi:transcriptional regulator with XRE-family HTH domain
MLGIAGDQGRLIMVDEATIKDREASRATVEDVTTPVWTKDMGARLKLVRMKLLFDQFELSVKLDMPQSTLSNLENGRVIHGPFTVAKLKEIFHKHTAFILLGQAPERFNARVIHKNYWDFRLKTQRKNASPYQNKPYLTPQELIAFEKEKARLNELRFKK